MKKFLIFALCTIVIASCSKGDDPQPTEGDFKISDCLAKFNHKYEDLLTAADVTKHIPIDEASFKQDISTHTGTYGSCSYKWDSDRTTTMEILPGHVYEMPEYNRAEIKLLSFYKPSDLELYNQSSIIELFDIGYRKLEDDEYAEMLTNLERAYAGKPEELETAKNLLEIRRNFNYTFVEGLGSSAFHKWHDEYGIELVVLVGAANFTIATKVSADKQVNLDLAIALAREVMAKCK